MKDMLQSFSINNVVPERIQQSLRCCRCKIQPKQQFIILQCNHLVCVSCITEEQETGHVLGGGIKCVCGYITYGNLNVSVTQPQYNERELANLQRNLRKDNIDKQINKIYKNDFVSTPLNENNKNSNNVTVNIHSKSRKHQKGSRDSSMRSAGLIHSKNTASTKNISRIITDQYNSNYGSFNQQKAQSNYAKTHLMLQKSQYPVENNVNKFQPALEQSQLYEEEGSGDDEGVEFQFSSVTPVTTYKKKANQSSKKHSINNKQKNTQCHHHPKFVQSQSADYIDQQNLILHKNNYKNMQKQNFDTMNNIKLRKQSKQAHKKQQSAKKSHKYSQSNASQVSNNRNYTVQNTIKRKFSLEIQNELKFLKVVHKRNLQSLDRVYQQIKNKINNDYESLQNNFKDMCLQVVVLGCETSQINFPKLIQMRYQTQIGKSLQNLVQQLKRYGIKRNFFQTPQFGQSSQAMMKQRSVRYTSPQIYHCNTQNYERNAPVYTQNQHSDVKCKPRVQKIIQIATNPCKNSYHTSNSNLLNNYFQNSQYPTNSKLHKKTLKKQTNIFIEL